MRDFANVAGATTVDASAADAALTRLEVDTLGLDAMDRRYLTMIADIYHGGPVGVETLAAGLTEPRDTIEEVIEPYLIQLGLIARTARGRCLNAGRVEASRPQPAGRRAGRSVRLRSAACGRVLPLRTPGYGPAPQPASPRGHAHRRRLRPRDPRPPARRDGRRAPRRRPSSTQVVEIIGEAMR